MTIAYLAGGEEVSKPETDSVETPERWSECLADMVRSDRETPDVFSGGGGNNDNDNDIDIESNIPFLYHHDHHYSHHHPFYHNQPHHYNNNNNNINRPDVLSRPCKFPHLEWVDLIIASFLIVIFAISWSQTTDFQVVKYDVHFPFRNKTHIQTMAHWNKQYSTSDAPLITFPTSVLYTTIISQIHCLIDKDYFFYKHPPVQKLVWIGRLFLLFGGTLHYTLIAPQTAQLMSNVSLASYHIDGLWNDCAKDWYVICNDDEYGTTINVIVPPSATDEKFLYDRIRILIPCLISIVAIAWICFAVIMVSNNV